MSIAHLTKKITLLLILGCYLFNQAIGQNLGKVDFAINATFSTSHLSTDRTFVAGKKEFQICPSPNAQFILSAHKEALVIYDMIHQDTMMSLEISRDNEMHSFVWNSKGTEVFSARQDGAVLILNTESGETKEFNVLPKGEDISTMSLNDDNSKLAIGTSNGKIYLVNLNTINVEGIFSEHRRRVEHIDWSPDGQKIISTGKDKKIIVADIVKLVVDTEIKTLDGSAILSLKWSNSGEKITTVDDCGKIYILAAKTLNVLQKQEFSIDCSSVTCANISRGDNLVYVGYKNNVLVYSLKTLSPLTIISGFAFDVSNLGSQFDESKIFVVDESGLGYISRIGFGATIIDDLNNWLIESPTFSVDDLANTAAVKRLFVNGGFRLWLNKNPLLFPLLKEQGQFETTDEYKQRFTLGLECLIDQMVMTSENDFRMNYFFDYLSKTEISNSRKPITFYPKDFDLVNYDIGSGEYSITLLNNLNFTLVLDRDKAKMLNDNRANCVIQGISQKNLENDSDEYINLKLIDRVLGIEHRLGSEIDLLEIIDKTLLPPEINISDVSLDEQVGIQELNFKLTNSSEGKTNQLIVEVCNTDLNLRYRYKIPELNGNEERIISLSNSISLKALDWNFCTINILEHGGYQITNLPINESKNLSIDEAVEPSMELDDRNIGNFSFEKHLNGNQIQWSHDGRYFIVNQNTEVQIWDVISRKAIRTIQTAPHNIVLARWGLNDIGIVCIDSEGASIVFDVDSGEILYTNDLKIPNVVNNFVPSRDNTMYVVDNEGMVYHINFITGNQVSPANWLTKDPVTDSYISPNSGQIVLTTNDSVHLFRLKTGKKHWSIKTNDRVSDISWNNSENFILLSGCDSSVQIRESINGNLIRAIGDDKTLIQSAKWSDYGDYIATLNSLGELLLWDGKTGVPFDSYYTHVGSNSGIIINPNGKIILSFNDENISLWSPGTFISTLESVSEYESTKFEDLSELDSIFGVQTRGYVSAIEMNQFETEGEHKIRLKEEHLTYAKNIILAQKRIDEQRKLSSINRKQSITDSRSTVFLGYDVIELGRYNMYSGLYPLKYDGVWYDIKLDRNEARQLYKYKENVSIRVISQLDSSLTQTININPSLIHSNGKEFAIGNHIEIEGGDYRNVLPPKLELTSVKFIDNDGDNILTAGESARVKLKITNLGEGDARYLRVITESSFSNYNGLSGLIDKIESGETVDYYLELAPDEYLKDSTVLLNLTFIEANGFGMDTVGLSFQTRAFKAPKLELTDFAVTDNEGRPIILAGEVIDITLRIANYGEGPANDVALQLTSSENVFMIGSNGNTITTELGALLPGQSKDYGFQAFCNKQAQSFNINYAIRDKSENPFSHSKDIGLEINKQTKGLKQLVFAEELASNVSETKFVNDLLEGLPDARDTNDNAIVVIIGNKNYRGNMPPVEYALNDAYTVQEYFKAFFGVKPGNIILKEDATLSDMKVLFGDKNNPNGRIKDLIKPGITELYVYYSGHGAPDLNSSKGFLMPTDANPSRLELTAFSMDDLVLNMSKLETKQNTLIVDACFSGGVSTGDYLVKNASSLGLKVKSISHNLPDNMAIMTASADDQVASWYSDKQHGLFTYFLLKGLQGEADLNSDNAVTFEELKAYVEDSNNGVPYKARELYSREQTPRIIGSNSFSIHLTK